MGRAHVRAAERSPGDADILGFRSALRYSQSGAAESILAIGPGAVVHKNQRWHYPLWRLPPG